MKEETQGRRPPASRLSVGTLDLSYLCTKLVVLSLSQSFILFLSRSLSPSFSPPPLLHSLPPHSPSLSLPLISFCLHLCHCFSHSLYLTPPLPPSFSVSFPLHFPSPLSIPLLLSLSLPLSSAPSLLTFLPCVQRWWRRGCEWVHVDGRWK